MEIFKKLILHTFLSLMCCLTFLGSENHILNIDANRISKISFNCENLYLFDRYKCQLWQLNSNFKLLNKFNLKGEGPGELRFINNLTFLKKSYVLYSSKKVVEYSYNHKIKSEFKFNDVILKTEAGNIIFKNNKKIRTKDSLQIKSEIFLKMRNNQQKLLFSNSLPKLTNQYFIKPFAPNFEIHYCSEKKIFAISNYSNCDFSSAPSASILIFNETGVKIGEIIVSSKNLLDESYKEKFFGAMFQDSVYHNDKNVQKEDRKHTYFPEYYPHFVSFNFDERGNIYIKTCNRRGNKVLHKKYKQTGDYLKELWLTEVKQELIFQGLHISFYKNHYYHFYVNDEGEYCIFKQKI